MINNECFDKITTEDIIFNSFELNNCNLQRGDTLNNILNDICNKLETQNFNNSFFIISDRAVVIDNQLAVITAFNRNNITWYVDDVLQTNNTSNSIIINKKSKVYAYFNNEKSNTLYIDFKLESNVCSLLINILNTEDE